MLKTYFKYVFLIFQLQLLIGTFNLAASIPSDGLPLYYWRQPTFVNFGDYISLKLVERIVSDQVRVYSKKSTYHEQKLLAIGSILSFAENGDVVWGTGINGRLLSTKHYNFSHLDIRAVRGPLTRQYLKEMLNIDCPEVYGDPALLIPYFFPEFKKAEHPIYDYIIIPHYSEISLFPKSVFPNAVYPTDPWDMVIKKILESKFVISSSLHGIIIAEAYGVPAKWLRITAHEHIFKYADYYLATNRPNFQYASSVEEALQAGGEPPFECDLLKLYEAFPFEFWINSDQLFNAELFQ